MGLHAFNAGCNAVCYQKDDRRYGMICAWASMLDYDTIGLLLGSQSATGKNVSVGAIVGVSALSSSQESIALRLGNNHSDKVDKFEGIEIRTEGSAILIAGARNNLICRVSEIVRFAGSEDDRFLVMKIIRADEDKTKDFLSAEKVLG